MKKRILAGMMMMILVLASAMSVSAAGSRTEPVYPSEPFEKRYVTSTEEGTFDDLKPEIQKVVEELNDKNTSSLDKDIQEKLDGKTLLTEVFDLIPIGNHSDCHERHYHEVELVVTPLTDKCEDLVILYYNGNEWKITTPIKVEGNKITVHFDELLVKGSPVGLYVNIKAGTATGTSPSTQGTSSAWMLWTAMALVVLGAGVVVSQKKRG